MGFRTAIRVILSAITLTLFNSNFIFAQETYAEKLGWEKGDRVVILHVDDAGMSHDSNVGALKAIQQGAANSLSVMMPCPWVPEIVDAIKHDPELDAGLHLTLTAEWEHYRWGPLVGKPAAPGLVDDQGALWHTVEQVVGNASADEVESEIRAQIERARAMGFEPTHLDTHMGTVFGSEEFAQRYIKVGIETGIPIMFPGGHATLLREDYAQSNRDESMVGAMQKLSTLVWQGGLPVLDDLHNTSYGWNLNTTGSAIDDKLLTDFKVQRYSDALRSLKPGVTMIIMHSTDTTENFSYISDSGATRRGDMLAMLDPRIKKVIKEEKLILTTWRELKLRRQQAK